MTALIAGRALSAGNKARDEWRDAAEAYAKFLRLKPETAAVWEQLGHCLQEGGDPVEAEAAYVKAMELDPENPDIILHVGRIKLALNDPAAAAYYLERAASFASPSVAAARELQALRSRPANDALSVGDKARDEKRWPEAIEAYEAFLRLKPGPANVWVQLGHCLAESGKADEAEKAYLKALELEPEKPDTLLRLGRVKRSMNDPEGAVRYLERAVALPSPVSDAREELRAFWSNRIADLPAGHRADEGNRLLEEIEAHAASLGRGLDAAKVWLQLGHRLKESGKTVEAEKAYVKAFQLSPENPDALLHLGRIKLILNDASSAERYLERAATLPRPSADAAKEIRALQSKRADRARSSGNKAWADKRWPEAIEAYTTFLGLKPDEANVWFRVGRCWTEIGNMTNAESAYLRALKLNPGNPETLVRRCG